MGLITSYSTLKTEVANVLNRTDLTSDLPLLIQLAEQNFERDERCRKLQDHGSFVINADGDSMPSDYDSIEDWYYDGPTYYGPIEVVPLSTVALYKAHNGPTGVPRVAAIVDGSVRYGPSPDTSYSTKLSYWRKIVPLSDSVADNWLLLDSPDIYLFGTLCEAEPFLKNDARIVVWKQKLEEALIKLDAETQRKQFSGAMVRRIPARRVIGG